MSDLEPTELTLAQQGFAMPPEWHPHVASWLAWPHNKETWPENQTKAQTEFLELVAAIADDEPVMLMCSGEEQIDQFLTINSQRSDKLTNVHIVDIQTNDAWVRDYGPTFVTNTETNEVIGLDWFYNAWGGKYPPYDLDQKVAQQICKHITRSKRGSEPRCFHQLVDFCIEGGGIEVDKHGLLMCTKSCALHPKRNAKITEAGVEKIFSDHLGCESVLWLAGDALLGDDTDGHIDQLARFTPSESILYAWCDDPSDPQYDLLEGNLEDLKRGLAGLGIDKELIPLCIPNPLSMHGQRLPASYCNFYVTNRKVIVPQFNELEDEAALKIIAEHFPDHEAIGLPSLNLAFGQGSFHCLTQQQPEI